MKDAGEGCVTKTIVHRTLFYSISRKTVTDDLGRESRFQQQGTPARCLPSSIVHEIEIEVLPGGLARSRV